MFGLLYESQHDNTFLKGVCLRKNINIKNSIYNFNRPKIKQEFDNLKICQQAFAIFIALI